MLRFLTKMSIALAVGAMGFTLNHRPDVPVSLMFFGAALEIGAIVALLFLITHAARRRSRTAPAGSPAAPVAPESETPWRGLVTLLMILAVVGRNYTQTQKASEAEKMLKALHAADHAANAATTPATVEQGQTAQQEAEEMENLRQLVAESNQRLHRMAAPPATRPATQPGGPATQAGHGTR